MLKLDEKLRDQIVTYLKGINVPAQTGADIIQITNALNSLEKEAEAVTSVVTSTADSAETI